jgi:hypothetical protein
VSYRARNIDSCFKTQSMYPFKMIVKYAFSRLEVTKKHLDITSYFLKAETIYKHIQREAFHDLKEQYKSSTISYTYVLSGVRGCVSYKTGSGFIASYTFTYLGTTCNTAISRIYTLHSSPLRTHYSSQSLLVLSRQRIYNSLTVTSNHTWSLLFTA